jgi:hypothetical protein
MFHAIPLLWRLHMVHHADLDVDLTTGLRFHPIEIILSMVLKMAVIVALGPPATAVLTFEDFLNGMAMINHGNIKVPIDISACFFRVIVLFGEDKKKTFGIAPFGDRAEFSYILFRRFWHLDYFDSLSVERPDCGIIGF